MSAPDKSPVSIRDATEQWTGQWADDTTNNTVTLRGSWKQKNNYASKPNDRVEDGRARY